MIFQDPISSLNPRRTVERHRRRAAQHLEARHRGRAQRRRSREVLDAGRASTRRPRRERKPHQFSGGQCQRISIARARGPRPQADHLRRAGVRARRVGAGPDPEPARGHEGPLRPDAGLHRPRPRRGEERQRPGGGDVPRQDLRGRRPPTSCTRTRPTPTPRCCWRSIPVPDPAVDTRLRPAHRGRAAVAGRPAVGLPVPHPLPVADERCAAEEPQMRQVGEGHFVACHHPLIGRGPRRRATAAVSVGVDCRTADRPDCVTYVMCARQALGSCGRSRPHDRGRRSVASAPATPAP